MAIKFRYVGDGAFLPGVPARDLTEDDWGEMDAAQRKLVTENVKHAGKAETKHAAIYDEGKSEPDAPATRKGG